jgi:hypothetical protein
LTSRVLRLLALSAALLLAAAALLEIGVRAADRLRGDPFDATSSRQRIEGIGRSLVGTAAPVGRDPGQLLQPYLAWEDADTERRLAEEAREYAKSAFDVVVLGGSEAAVLGRAGAEALRESLRRDPSLRDREIRVHAYALEGYKQPQPLMELLLLLSMGHEPDLVLELDGLDDANLGWSNGRSGIHPLHPSIERWSKSSGGARSDWELAELFHETHAARARARSLAGWIVSSGIWRSALLGPIAERRLESLRGELAACEARAASYLATRPREAELDGPRFPKDDAGIAETIARGWEEASVSMHALCTRRGIGFVHVLEPAPHGTPSDAVANVYPRLRSALPRLRGRGIPCIDASELFREEGLRDKEGKPTSRGCEVLAGAIADAWLAAAPR